VLFDGGAFRELRSHRRFVCPARKSGSRRVIAYGATCRGYRAGIVMPGSISRQYHNQL
jgi:hypothetical protein